MICVTYDETPQELIDLCCSCRRATCPGSCLDYFRLAHEIEYGIKPKIIVPEDNGKTVYEKRHSAETCMEGYNALMEAFGEVHTIREWTDIYGMKYHTLYMRLRSGHDLETALSKPKKEYKLDANAKKITINGKSLTKAQWGRINHIPYSTICTRVRAGWPVELAVTVPSMPKGGNRQKQWEALQE